MSSPLVSDCVYCLILIFFMYSVSARDCVYILIYDCLQSCTIAFHFTFFNFASIGGSDSESSLMHDKHISCLYIMLKTLKIMYGLIKTVIWNFKPTCCLEICHFALDTVLPNYLR